MAGYPGFWSAINSGALNGSGSNLYPFARNAWFVGDFTPQFAFKRAGSIEELLALMTTGDVAYIGPKYDSTGANIVGYQEGNLVIPATLKNITLIGAANRGEVFIEPSTSGDEGLQILSDGVTLVNIGVADGGTGDWGLSVGSQTVSPDRFRAYGCKFEGSTIAARLWGAGDVLIQDCEFAWANTGLQMKANDIGFNTQIFIQNSRFHNNATACMSQDAASQVVNNLQFWNNIMDQLEDGTEPTDFILLSDNGNTGIIAGNQFAIATNDTAKLTIGTGLMWGPNGTEAGWSTARPA